MLIHTVLIYSTGNFYNSTINLKGNTLETIDEATFGVVFESMISGGNLGSVSFSSDLFNFTLFYLIEGYVVSS